MGKLAQICEDLAEGTRVEAAWKKLIGNPTENANSILLTECPRLIEADKLDELDLCYQLLATPEANENASCVHKGLFNLDSGADRLELLAQTVGCAGLAIVSKVPNSGDQQLLESWAKRAIGPTTNGGSAIEISGIETSETLIRRALNSVVDHHDEKQHFANVLTRWFSGIEIQVEHRLTVPILLFDQREGNGVVGEIIFTKTSREQGSICLPSPRTRLQVEIDGSTRSGIDGAWERAQRLHPSNCEVHWELCGISSISGRSAEAAFNLGFQLLLQGAPYDTRCLITAAVNDDALGHVAGVNDNGSPKLEAASLRRGEATVIVSNANRLSAPDEELWASRGVTVTACQDLGDAYQIVSRQLQQIETMLRSQIQQICELASQRFGREVSSARELDEYCVPMRLARGSRMVPDEDSDDFEIELSEVNDQEAEEDVEREIVFWDDFADEFSGRAVVLGDPGFGKTTLLWNHVAQLCQETIDALRTGVPIDEIEFALFLPVERVGECERPDVSSVASLFAASLDVAPELLVWLEGRILNGKCLLCLDALDEASDQRVVAQHLSQFAGNTPNAQLLLTSRLTGFSKSPFDVTNENQLELLSFDEDQMRAVVETWFPECSTKVDDVWRLISRDTRLTDVLSSPILLNLAREQIIERFKRDQPLPSWRRRVELYDGFLKLALDNLRSRTDAPLKEMESEEFPLLLEELAFDIWLDNPRNTIVSRKTIRDSLKRIIKEAELWGLKERFPNLLDDLQDSGIIVPLRINDESSSVMFLHRKIGEYLAGRCIANRINRGDASAWATLDKVSWSPDWKQVILFCASCLDSPEELLERFANPDPTSDNPCGDDVLRHRLLLAAQCLPELESVPSAQTQRITDAVVSEFRNHSTLGEAVAALQALFLVGATIDGKPIAFKLSGQYFAGRFLTSAAYSDELFEHFRELLWEACEPDDRRHRMTRRNPTPYASSLLAIVDTLDIDRLNVAGGHDEGHFWRVMGAVFREASIQDSKAIVLNAEFLRRLSAYLFQKGAAGNVGLRQFIEYLPPISVELLNQSSLLIEAANALRDHGRREIHNDIFTLIGAIGEAAGKSSEIQDALLDVDSPATNRHFANAVATIAPSLSSTGFVKRLIEEIETSSNQAEKKKWTSLLLALYPANTAEWRDAVVSLAETDSRLISRLLPRILRQDEDGATLDLILELTKHQATRNTGLSSLASLVEQLTRSSRKENRSTKLLPLFDRIACELFPDGNWLTFDDCRCLDAILKSKEIGIRGLLSTFVTYALQHRANKKLIRWAFTGAMEEGFDGEVSRAVDSTLRFLSKESRDLLQKLFVGLDEEALAKPLSMSVLAQSDSGSVIERLQISTLPVRKRLRVISHLPDKSTLGLDLAQLVVEGLRERHHEVRNMAIKSLSKLIGECLSEAQCNSIIGAIDGRARKLNSAVFDLIVQAKHKFEKPLLEAFKDPDNPGRDGVAMLLPALGERLLSNGIAEELAGLVDSGDKKEKLMAMRVLSLTLEQTSGKTRFELHAIAASAYQVAMSRRTRAEQNPTHLLATAPLLLPFEDHLHLTPWLIEQLGSSDDSVARLAQRLLTDRAPSRSGNMAAMNWQRFLELYTGEIPRFSINQGLSCQLLARLGSFHFRVFSNRKEAIAIPVGELVEGVDLENPEISLSNGK